MKKHVLTLLLALAFVGFVNAQDSTINKQFMHITAVESVYAILGDSKLIITNPDGTQSEEDLENIFNAMGAVKIKGIKTNELRIAQALKRYTDKGWKLEQATPLSVSPGKDANGILMTRYILSK
jgi:hypothetical protein